MPSKHAIASYNVVDNYYHCECPSCDYDIAINLSMEEEVNIEMGYGLYITCPNCGQSIKVTLD